MPTPPLSDETLQEAVASLNAHGSQSAAALALGIARETLQNRLRRAAERGLMGTEPVLPGFRISKTTTVYEGGELVKEFIQQKPEPGEAFEVPAGHHIKGVSAYTDADGRVIGKWTKTREGELDPLALAEHLKAAFLDYVPSPPLVPAPAEVSDDLLTFLPLSDWHIGMFAWRREVGSNWDLKIAERTIGAAIETTIAKTDPSAHCVVLGGGDLLHSDNKRNETSNGTRQDQDGRYPKLIETAARMVAQTVDLALRRHEHVTVRILPGNHDEHACVAVTYFLAAWFRNEPRVTVDTDPSLFWWHRHGQVLLGATHGHIVKLDKMPEIMAHRRAADWGVTKFRFVHGFHLHHKRQIATEGAGCICEIHQAPIPQDAWHYGSGYLSGRSVKAIKYHRTLGEVGRVIEPILDGVHQ